MLFLKRHLIYKGCETKQKMIRGGENNNSDEKKNAYRKKPF